MAEEKKEADTAPATPPFAAEDLDSFESELVTQIIKDLDREPPSRSEHREIEIELSSAKADEAAERGPAAGELEGEGDAWPTDEDGPLPSYFSDWYRGVEDLPRSFRQVSYDLRESGEDLPLDALVESTEEPPVETPSSRALPPPEDELVRSYDPTREIETFEEIEAEARSRRKRKGESAGTTLILDGEQLAILPSYFEERFEFDTTPSVKYLEYILLGGLIVSCLLTALALIRLGNSKTFPLIAPGSYVGRISGLHVSDSEEDTGFYLESMPGDRYLFVIARSDWRSQVMDFSNEMRGGNAIPPVKITGPQGVVQFVGSETQPGKFSGSVLNANNRVRGQWELNAIEEQAEAEPNIPADRIKAWHEMRVVLQEIEERIGSIEPKVNQQNKEIARITEFITEEEKLKKRADEKYNRMKEELASLERILKVKHKEGRNLERQFDISQRVKGMGRLVALSRDSLEREARWIEVMERSVTGEYPPDFEEAYRRGVKIMELKRQIAREKDRIVSLGKQAPRQAGKP